MTDFLYERPEHQFKNRMDKLIASITAKSQEPRAKSQEPRKIADFKITCSKPWVYRQVPEYNEKLIRT